ncbi:MAG: hypothetical protein KDK05_07365 [Candidatus Competibacteraceae bacterium]|nr:hypothetical protein [Candidatus Competibacteraceae bacterium]
MVFMGLLLLGCTLSISAAPLQKSTSLDDLELSYGVDRTTLQLDEQLTFTLTVIVPENINVRFEAVADTLGPFSVVARYPSGPTALADGRNRWQRRYLLAPTDTGSALIPPLQVAFFTEKYPLLKPPCKNERDCINSRHRRVPPEVRLADTRRELSSSALTLTISPAQAANTVAAATDEPANSAVTATDSVIDTQPFSYKQQALLALLLLAVLSLWLLRHQTKSHAISDAAAKRIDVDYNNAPASTTPAITSRPATAEEPFDPSLEHALQQQDYTQVYQQLRTALSSRYGVALTHCSSAEITQQLASQLDAEQRPQLDRLLTYCDWLRFRAGTARATTAEQQTLREYLRVWQT